MRLPTLLFCLAAFGLASVSFAVPKENKYILLPGEYHHSTVSPDGRYAAIYRRVLDSLEYFAKPEGPSIYITRIYILDLATNNLVLAGPPDKKGKRRKYKDWVERAIWAADGSLLILTKSELMSIDPATGAPIERFNIHATLREESSLPLSDSLDKPLLFYNINWSRGASVTFYALTPRTGKIRRFAEPGLVKDLAVSITPPRGNQALTLRAYTKGTNQGFTWELDDEGELQVYPLNLDTEWISVQTPNSVCKKGERIMARHLETGDAVAELRLHNYRTNEFVGAAVLIPRPYVDLASSLLTAESVNRMRRSSGSLPFRSVALQPILSLVDQLRNAYPLASVRILNTSTDGNKVALRVSAQNRPLSFFIFDIASGKLRKVMEGQTDWAERKLATGTYVKYASPHEHGGTGTASFIPALEPSSETTTIVELIPEPSFDFDWGFSSTTRFLSAEGFDTLTILIPWSLQLSLSRASTPTELEEAQQNCTHFITSVLEAAKEQSKLNGKTVYTLHGSAAALFPSIPEIADLEPEKVFVVNPRFHTGLPGASLVRLKNLERFSFKRYVDPKSWRNLLQQTQPKISAPVVVIWRENDRWWDQENGVEEQIRSFELYCKDVGIDFELDRWSEGAWRSLETWKLRAAVTIDIMDHIRGTDSGILDTWNR